jgi:hypothetical protein
MRNRLHGFMARWGIINAARFTAKRCDMCDPVTIGAIVSTVGSVYSGYQQNQAAKVEAKNAEASAKFQAEQAEADANTAKQEAEIRAEKVRKAAKMQVSQARAAAAASGMEVGEGTALEISKGIASESEYDAQMTIFGGKDTQRRGFQQAEGYRFAGESEAANIRRQGKAALTGSIMGAATDALGAWSSMKGASGAKAADSGNSYHNHVGPNAKGGGARRKY